MAAFQEDFLDQIKDVHFNSFRLWILVEADWLGAISYQGPPIGPGAGGAPPTGSAAVSISVEGEIVVQKQTSTPAPSHPYPPLEAGLTRQDGRIIKPNSGGSAEGHSSVSVPSIGGVVTFSDGFTDAAITLVYYTAPKSKIDSFDPLAGPPLGSGGDPDFTGVIAVITSSTAGSMASSGSVSTQFELGTRQAKFDGKTLKLPKISGRMSSSTGGSFLIPSISATWYKNNRIP